MHPYQPLLTISARGTTTVVTIPMLAQASLILLEALNLDLGLYSLHSLRRGGAMAAYHGGSDQLDIKRHGLWASDAFGLHVTALAAVASTVAASLSAAVEWGSYFACLITT